MDYEKKYKEALGWIQSLYNGLHGKTKEEAERYFPELKESEDERIRKALINFVEQYGDNYYGQLAKASAIAWLEKQGNKDKLIKELGKYKVKYTQEVLSQQLEKQGETFTKKDVDDAYLKGISDAKNELERQGEKLPVGFYYVNSEGKKFYSDTFKYGDVTLHVEKQGEQKEIDYNEELKKCKANPLYFFDKYMKVKFKEQNHTDKAEPKFKVGDWITNNYAVWYIESIHNGLYSLKDPNGGVIKNSNPETVDNKFHLWTIQDAKDGDVLSFNDGHGNDSIELIKSITEKKIEFWFCLTNSNRYEVFDGITPYTNLVSRKNATPATKEERDMFFQKMKEAGYEWSDKDRKLIKIVK